MNVPDSDMLIEMLIKSFSLLTLPNYISNISKNRKIITTGPGYRWYKIVNKGY